MARVWRSTISGNVYGSPFQNVLHFETANDALTSSEVNLEVRNHWIGFDANVGVKSWCSNSVKWTSVTSKPVWPIVGLDETLIFDQGGQQSPTTELFLQLCIILRLQSNVVGRPGRGRHFVPTVLNGFTTNGFLDDTFFAFAQDALTQLRIRFIKDFNPALAGPLWVVVAGRQNPSERGQVLAITPSNKLGTQRRRNF